MGIGINFKKIIDAKNLTVSEVAKITKIAPQTLYAIIKRDKENQKVSPDILDKIANALAVSIWDLYGIDEKTAHSSAFVNSLIGDLDDVEDDYPGELEKIKKNAAIAEEVDSLKCGKHKILNDYNALNTVGKQEAEKRVEELTFIKKYTE